MYMCNRLEERRGWLGEQDKSLNQNFRLICKVIKFNIFVKVQWTNSEY